MPMQRFFQVTVNTCTLRMPSRGAEEKKALGRSEEVTAPGQRDVIVGGVSIAVAAY